jgi:hypothetical protein
MDRWYQEWLAESHTAAFTARNPFLANLPKRKPTLRVRLLSPYWRLKHTLRAALRAFREEW